MATAQEIGGRGLEAVAGRERWSALDKPPSVFAPCAPPCFILLLAVAVCMHVCLPLIRKSAVGGIVPVICTLLVLRQGRGGPHHVWVRQHCVSTVSLCLSVLPNSSLI